MERACRRANTKGMSLRCRPAPRRAPRRFGGILSATALVALLLAAVAGACTAVAIRFGDHPPYARAVVTFTGGTVAMRDVEATDPNPFDGSAALRVSRAGIGTRVASARGLGISVSILARTGALQITLGGAAPLQVPLL